MSNPAYGYCNNKKGRLKLSPKEAKVVRFIYDEYLNGKGIHIIARELTESKIKSPKGNNIWNSATVYGILKNPIYTGDILHQKTYSMNIVPFERKINKGEVPQILIENDHKGIVTKEEYETVQIMLSCKPKNEKNEITEFRGKIICSKCGDVFYRQVKPKQDITWTCKNRIISKDYCDIDIVNEELIKELFIKMWNKLSNNYEQILIPMVKSLYAIKEHTGETIVSRLLGYKRNKNGQLKIIPEEAEIVKFIFAEFMEGCSYNKIANKLKEKGCKTIRGKTNWGVASIIRILSNEKYIGHTLCQKIYTVDFLIKERRTNNGEVNQYYTENSHQGIIPRELFYRVQEEMERRVNSKNKAPSKNETDRKYRYNSKTVNMH